MFEKTGRPMKEQDISRRSILRNREPRQPSLYVAAPFFSEAESKYNLAIKKVLEPSFRVFLPQESGCLMSEMINSGVEVKAAAERVYQTDIRAIQECDVLLIVLNGRAIDEGAAFELGFASAIERSCFALQTDTRFAHAWGNNPMITASVRRVFRSLSELQDWALNYPKRTVA